MANPIFSYSGYKTYVLDRIRAEPHAGHGVRNRLAQAIGCQAAYISHVLNGDRHFSVEQAEAASRFLGLTSEEAEYFVWLVERERAGTPSARKFFARLLEQKRAQYLQLRKRVDISDDLTDADKSIYYSSYLYAAVHMLVTVPGFRTPELIAGRLKQPLSQIAEILDFLKKRGLVAENRAGLEPGSKFLFIGKSSPFILQHHGNWRVHALQSIARRSDEDLHLSMTVTLSEKDAQSLRQRMAEFIEEISGRIKESKEERLMNFNLDFFEI